jgi:hypothetical protein
MVLEDTVEIKLLKHPTLGSLAIGKLPNRKSVMLYKITDSGIGTLGTFHSDQDAQWVADFLNTMIDDFNGLPYSSNTR